MSASVRATRAGIEVVRARARDLVALSCLVAAACQDLPPYKWLIDEPQARRHILPNYFHLVLRNGHTHGEVYTTTDAAGVAVWLPATLSRPPTLMEDRARLVETTGAWAKQFLVRQALLDNVVGEPGCAQLMLLAVDPACRHRGVGTALLDHQHQRLDQAGLSVFARVDAHDRDWYLRHGYIDSQVLCTPGEDGPHLHPMYRRPHIHKQEKRRDVTQVPLAPAVA